MSTRGVRTGVAAVLAGVLALSAVAMFHRVVTDEPLHHRASLAANLADTVAPTAKVEQPGVAAAPAAALVAAGAPLGGGTAATTSIPPSFTAHAGTVRGPPGEAAA